MNDNRRRGSGKKTESDGPRFCSRCGGAFMAQNTFTQTNVCRCKKEPAPPAANRS